MLMKFEKKENTTMKQTIANFEVIHFLPSVQHSMDTLMTVMFLINIVRDPSYNYIFVLIKILIFCSKTDN